MIRPEREMGERVAKSLLSHNIVDLIDIDDDYSIIEINAPKSWMNKSLIDLDARRKYGINVLGVRKAGDEHLRISPSAEYVIEEGDHLMVLAETKVYEQFEYLNQL